jgi:hypothetical protein
MTKPAKFLLDTDYATLKNSDDYVNVFSVGATSLPAGGELTRTFTFSVNTRVKNWRNFIKFNLTPRVVAGDTAFYSPDGELTYGASAYQNAAGRFTVFVLIRNYSFDTPKTTQALEITVNTHGFLLPFPES